MLEERKMFAGGIVEVTKQEPRLVKALSNWGSEGVGAERLVRL